MASDTSAPASPGSWDEGWWQHARRVPSPNFGPRPSGPAGEIDLVVLHSISLPPGVYGGPEVEHLFTNCLDCDAHPYFGGLRGLEVSAHFFIRRGGEVVQFVCVDDRAWHAGQSVWKGRDNCNDRSVGIEFEGIEGSTFEDAQYAAASRLLRDLSLRHPVRDVVGHEHVAPGRKADPGPGFNWEKMMETLSELSLSGPPAPIRAGG